MNYLQSDFNSERETATAYRRRREAENPARRFPLGAVLGILASLAIIAVLTFTAATAAHAAPQARAVALADADYAPTVLTVLRPHMAVTYARGRDGTNCARGGYFSDVSAYSWRGGKLAPQRWDRNGLNYWNIGHGHHGRVTFNGATFNNESHTTVLVAGWCE